MDANECERWGVISGGNLQCRRYMMKVRAIRVERYRAQRRANEDADVLACPRCRRQESAHADGVFKGMQSSLAISFKALGFLHQEDIRLDIPDQIDLRIRSMAIRTVFSGKEGVVGQYCQ